MKITRQTIARFTICCQASEVERVVALRDACPLSTTGIWLESGIAESPHSPGIRGLVLCCDAGDAASIRRIEDVAK